MNQTYSSIFKSQKVKTCSERPIFVVSCTLLKDVPQSAASSFPGLDTLHKVLGSNVVRFVGQPSFVLSSPWTWFSMLSVLFFSFLSGDGGLAM
jgi:hypothetical protein